MTEWESSSPLTRKMTLDPQVSKEHVVLSLRERLEKLGQGVAQNRSPRSSMTKPTILHGRRVSHSVETGAVWQGLSFEFLRDTYEEIKKHTFYAYESHYGPSRKLKQPLQVIPWELVSTTDVVEQFIKPKSLEFGGPYCLKAGADCRQIHDATVFISHAWQCSFVDLLNGLFTLGRESPHEYFWLDILMVDQNEADQLPQYYWTDTLANAIADIGRTVVVLSPWNNPAPITRAWCLFEIYSTIVSEESKFDVLLPSAQEDALRKAVIDDESAVVNAMLQVAAEKADCHNPADKRMIHDAMQGLKGGYHSLNVCIKSKLRIWILQKLVTMTETMKPSSSLIDHAKLCHNVGLILLHNDLLQESVAVLRHAVSIREGELGHQDPDTASSYNYLGLALRKKGDFHGALVMFKQAYEIVKTVYGEVDHTTAESCGHLGTTLRKMGKLEEALSFYQQGLDIKRQVRGENHPSTAWPYNNIGEIKFLQGEYVDALEYYKTALDIREDSLGHNHPDTARSYNRVGFACQILGRYDEAEVMLRKCISIDESILGVSHRYTIKTYNILGDVLKSKGDMEAANTEYEKAKSATALGVSSPVRSGII